MKLDKQPNIQSLSEKMKTLPWEDKQFYAEWVSQTYYFVSHSTRLLEHCIFHAADEEAKARYSEHIEEEDNHELIALQDLKKLGFSVSDFGEHEETRAFYSGQYKLIQSSGDRPFLGYVLALEILAEKVGLHIYQAVEKNYGPKAGNFLRVHGEEDEDHVVSAFKLLETFSNEEQILVKSNFDETLSSYSKMIDKCLEQSSKNKSQAA